MKTWRTEAVNEEDKVARCKPHAPHLQWLSLPSCTAPLVNGLRLTNTTWGGRWCIRKGEWTMFKRRPLNFTWTLRPPVISAPLQTGTHCAESNWKLFAQKRKFKWIFPLNFTPNVERDSARIENEAVFSPPHTHTLVPFLPSVDLSLPW